MVDEIELYVCDEDGLVLLGDDENPICIECEKPMVLAKFKRKLTQDAPDLLPAPACCASFVFDGTHHKDCHLVI